MTDYAPTTAKYRWWELGKQRRCPHARLRGVYGDEIVFATPRFNRLQCLDCDRFLDGPVSLATHISINGGIFPHDFYGPIHDPEGDTDD